MTELLPCPFCGGEARIFALQIGKGWRVVCSKPFCAQGPDGDTEAEAIAAWNTRAAYEMDGWFYLPKPKEGIVDYGEPEITRTENGYKVRQTVDVVDEAARRWSDELGEYVMRRICEVWNSRAERTCRWEYPQGVNGWIGYTVCSSCGEKYDECVTDTAHYCPNCGAKVVGE